MAAFLKHEQNTLSIIPELCTLVQVAMQFVQTCRALPACHQSCHCLFALRAKAHRYKLCIWNSWPATEELNFILHCSKPLDKLKTCDHMEPMQTFVSTEFSAFQPLPCISSLVFPSLSLACGSSQICSGSSKAQVNDSGVWLHPTCNHSCRRAAPPPYKDLYIPHHTLQCKTFGGTI